MAQRSKSWPKRDVKEFGSFLFDAFPAPARPVEGGNERTVPPAGCGLVLGADHEQSPQLPSGECPASWQDGASDAGEIGGAVEVFSGDKAEPPAFFESVAQSGEHLVDGGGGVLLGKHGAQGGGVLVAQLVSGEGLEAASSGADFAGDDGEGFAHGSPESGASFAR